MRWLCTQPESIIEAMAVRALKLGNAADFDQIWDQLVENRTAIGEIEGTLSHRGIRVYLHMAHRTSSVRVRYELYRSEHSDQLSLATASDHDLEALLVCHCALTAMVKSKGSRVFAGRA